MILKSYLVIEVLRKRGAQIHFALLKLIALGPSYLMASHAAWMLSPVVFASWPFAKAVISDQKAPAPIAPGIKSDASKRNVVGNLHARLEQSIQ